MKLRFVFAVAVAVVLAGTIGSAQQGVIHSVTGHGSVSSDSGGVLYRDEYSFTAVQHADMTVSGQVQYTDHVTGLSFHASVIDLKVDGNWAKVTAILPEGWECPVAICGGSYHPTHEVFVVIDNGEGKNAPADEISWAMGVDPNFYDLQMFIDMFPREYVAWEVAQGLTPPLFDYIHGDIQVR
jgi:hypothetical protein